MAFTKSQEACAISHEGIEFLCGLINKIVSSPKDLIDDINLATNTTNSSVKIKSLVDQALKDSKEYSDLLCSSLIKLTCEKTTVQPTLGNSEKNVIYLYSADGNAPFDQYLKISDTELIDLGNTSISLNDYLTITDAVATYAKLSDFNTLTTEVTNIKKDIGTDDISSVGTSVKDAIVTLNTNKEENSNKVTKLDSTSTDTQYPSALAVKTELDKKVDKTSIVTTINSSSTDEQVASAKIINSMLGSKYGKQPSSKLNEYTTILDWAKNNIGNSVGYEGQSTYDDCPLGNTWGTLICLGNAVTTGLLVIAYHNFTNTIYYRVIKGNYVSTATWMMDWQRICTTSVADVSQTTFNIDDNDYLGETSSGCFYYVYNGIAYVTLHLIGKTKNIGGGTYIKLLSSGKIPKSKIVLEGSVCDRNNSVSNLMYTLLADGSVNFVSNTNVGGSYYFSFSYPVSES